MDWDLRSGTSGSSFSGFAGFGKSNITINARQNPGVTFNHLVMIDNFVNIQNTRRRLRESFALPGGTAA